MIFTFILHSFMCGCPEEGIQFVRLGSKTHCAISPELIISYFLDNRAQPET